MFKSRKPLISTVQICRATSLGGHQAPLFPTTDALNAAVLVSKVSAWVYDDPETGNNGIWTWDGAAWQWALPLPYSFISAFATGGTASAIEAMTLIPVNTSSLILLTLAEDYEGTAATVSFNGGPALNIKASSGGNVTRLTGGSIIYGMISGPDFRLANDDAIARLIYEARDDAQAARAIAQVAQSGAEAARDLAAGFVNDIVAEKEVPKTATVAGMAFLAFPSGMNYIETFGAGAANDGVPTLLARVSAKPTTHDFYVRSADRFLPNGTIDPVTGGYWEIASPVLNPMMIGAQFNGTDDTAEIQKTFIAGSVLKRRVVLPPGATYLSLARSIHDKACLLLPEGLQLQGSGRLSKISRHPSERGLNGVLMVNEGYDTQGGYDAAGNITLENFYIEDGDDSATRGLGDLIAFGHAENVVVRGVHSGNHDQHFVDVCSCKNVLIEKNVCRQELSTGDSPIQVDGADALGIWGLYLDDTPTVDVTVDGNNILHKGLNAGVHLCHAANMAYKGIRVSDNDVDAAYLSGSNCIQLDPSANIDVGGLSIVGNRCTANHASARGINLFNNGGLLRRVKVVGNTVSGLARVGIYIGSNQVDADFTVKRWREVVLALNTVNVDATGSSGDTNGLALFGVEGVCEGNLIELSRDTAPASGVVVINMPRGLNFRANSVRGNFATAPGAGASSAVRVIKQSGGVDTNLTIADNDLYGGNVNYNVIYSVSANWGSGDKAMHLVSGNRFPTAPLVANIQEVFAASDGTNGWHEVDLSSIGSPTGGAVAIAANQYYVGLPLGLKKVINQQASPAKITLQFAPNNIDDIDSDCEAIQFAIADTGTKDCVGTQVCDVNQAAGTFSIITGSAGVTAVIDNTTRKAVYRTAGYLKAFAGI